MTDIKQRLEYLRKELRQERISCGELVELQSLRAHIEVGDTELLEAAGVPETAARYKHVSDTEIEDPSGASVSLTIYFDRHSNAPFAVDSSLLEQGHSFFNPYSGEEVDSEDDNLFDDD